MAWSDEVATLLDDATEEFGADITLRRITPGAFSAATGQRGETVVSQTVRANRTVLRPEQGGAGGFRRGVYEVRYEVQAALVTIGTPAPGWRVADASLPHAASEVEIILVERDAERQNLILVGRLTA